MSENDEQSKCPQCGGEKRYRALTCENAFGEVTKWGETWDHVTRNNYGHVTPTNLTSQ